MAQLIDLTDLVTVLTQSFEQLKGPLGDMLSDVVQAVVGNTRDLGAEEEKTSKQTKSFANTVKLLGDGFPKISSVLRDLGSWIDRVDRRSESAPWRNRVAAAGTLTAGAAGAVQAPAGLGLSAAGTAGGVAGSVVGTFQSAFGSIVSMVDKIDPSAVQMFQLAMNDLMAVMGEMLTPILKAGTELVRKFADILLTIKPAIDPLIAVVVDLVKLVAELLVPIFQALLPFIQLFAAALKALMPIVRMLADVFKFIAKGFQAFGNALIDIWNETVARLPGVSKIKKFTLDEGRLQSSMGKAIQNTGFTSGEELGRQTRAAILKLGPSDAERTAINTEMIAKNTFDAVEAIKQQIPWLQKLAPIERLLHQNEMDTPLQNWF